MDTITAAAAAVTGARHHRVARNGQDAAAAWSDDRFAAVVVCDGCSAGPSSEVGARLGASLALASLTSRLPREPLPELWANVRADITRALADLAARMSGNAIHDQLLFTIVAAVATPDATAVWALGDGAFWLGLSTSRADVHALGPFANNQPPYLAYDLLGEPRDATLVIAPPCDVVIATDGLADVDLATFTARRFATHPDALRRHLAVLARDDERIDWHARRVARTPARLQDDGAVGVILR